MKTEFNLRGVHSYGELLKALQDGAKLCEVDEYRDGTKNLSVVVYADSNYIYWRYFGSSANRATARDMEFVVTRIFRMSFDQFIRHYVWA